MKRGYRHSVRPRTGWTGRYATRREFRLSQDAREELAEVLCLSHRRAQPVLDEVQRILSASAGMTAALDQGPRVTHRLKSIERFFTASRDLQAGLLDPNDPA